MSEERKLEKNNRGGKTYYLRALLRLISELPCSKPELIQITPLKSQAIRTYLNTLLDSQLIKRVHDAEQGKTSFEITEKGETFLLLRL